jgi:hypothetical protein
VTLKGTAFHVEIAERKVSGPIVTDAVIAEHRHARKLDLREPVMVVPCRMQAVLGQASQRSCRNLHAAYIPR